MNNIFNKIPIIIGIILFSILVNYLVFRVLFLFFINPFAILLTKLEIINRSIFPWLIPINILVCIIFLFSIFILLLLKMKFKDSEYIKEGFNYSLLIHVLFFVYFLIMLLDNIFSLGLPRWYYF